MAQKQVKPIPAQPARAAAPQPARPAASQQKVSNHTPAQFVFDKGNYRLLFISIAVIFIGFALMSGTTDIYDTRKIVIAPLVVLSGFAIGFLAIFKKPETK